MHWRKYRLLRQIQDPRPRTFACSTHGEAFTPCTQPKVFTCHTLPWALAQYVDKLRLSPLEPRHLTKGILLIVFYLENPPNTPG
ncbi:uncharacterized protein G2W53_027434 [Senna tora]|uniref:Uncharacterized protein n=1 Tax=Senna tora TaxID=362788 RepID=A0A834TJ12_9FABA|nr:uncharacterized protein G2W53_027434 [Senna tora]